MSYFLARAAEYAMYFQSLHSFACYYCHLSRHVLNAKCIHFASRNVQIKSHFIFAGISGTYIEMYERYDGGHFDEGH